MVLINYLLGNWRPILNRTGEHLIIISVAILFALLIGISLGIFIYFREKYAGLAMGVVSVLFTIPSLALFGILILILAPFKVGIGKVPAIIALTIYSLLPITRNTYTSLKQTDPSIIQSAYGMGMTARQVVFMIMFPISLPVVMAGIRNAVVVGVGVGTISYLIGAGGLGYFIFEGIQRTNNNMILAGTILISFLGIMLNYLLMVVENVITPRGLKLGTRK
jgi:osmoprotectant transport system permease protein